MHMTMWLWFQRLVHNWWQRYSASVDRQRPASWPFGGWGHETGAGIPVLWQTWRRWPTFILTLDCSKIVDEGCWTINFVIAWLIILVRINHSFNVDFVMVSTSVVFCKWTHCRSCKQKLASTTDSTFHNTKLKVTTFGCQFRWPLANKQLTS